MKPEIVTKTEYITDEKAAEMYKEVKETLVVCADTLHGLLLKASTSTPRSYIRERNLEAAYTNIMHAVQEM